MSFTVQRVTAVALLTAVAPLDFVEGVSAYFVGGSQTVSSFAASGICEEGQSPRPKGRSLESKDNELG